MDEIIDLDIADDESTAVVPTDEEATELEIWKPGKAPVTLLRCSTCYLRSKCPKRDDASDYCPIKKESPEYDMSTPQGLLNFVQSLLEIQKDRIYRLTAFEQIEGGLPDPNVSEEIKNFMEIVERLKKIVDSKDDFLVIKAKGKSAANLVDKMFGDI